LAFDEKAFLADYRSNPQRAFRALMDGFKERVHIFCARASSRREDAEDLTQEVFIRAWRGLESFRGESSLSTWIYRIAWNVCASHLERKGNAPEVSSYSEVDDADDDEPRHIVPVEDLEFRNFENRQFLDVLFQRIPAQHKLVLTMYYLQELSYDEIGAVTGWPLGTVKATLHRAKANLRIQALAELGQ